MGKQMPNCSRGLLLLLLALLGCFSILGHVYGNNLDYTRSATMNEGRNNVNINGLVPVPCNIFCPSKGKSITVLLIHNWRWPQENHENKRKK
uniref:OSJNBa0057M08.26 protein n=1 Tax=Oryza sativa subsp. japonica TaxID=39947 RepID=Q5JPX5_ORYSJ|nr:OSJNBa0057M08.26 [Oryza sativa Japonica Group]